MNILSCFDGISAAQVALRRANISYDKYFSSEIDKFALKVVNAHFPDTIQLGDIEKWKDWDLPRIDLLIGGSPCTGFSVSGKRLGFDDSRSKLFFTFAQIKNTLLERNPNLAFILENVRMKKEWRDIITQYMGVEPILINSATLSAQERKRYYWCNFPVSQPEDKGILLADIIEDGVVDRNKSYCIDANYKKGGSLAARLKYDKMEVIPKGQSERRLMVRIESNNGISYRKLTVKECEKLQTFDPEYIDCISNTQRYKVLGNSFTVDVIVHILNELKLHQPLFAQK